MDLQLEKKFKRILDKKSYSLLNDYEIETPQGWKDISNIMQTIPYKVWYLKTDNNKELYCADTHIIFDDDYNQKYVKDLKIGDLIQTKTGLDKIIEIKELDYSEEMYDIEINSFQHEYYTNDIISHNTTIVAAYLLHQLCFRENIMIAVLANKNAQAKEVLTRIKEMFEALPQWLKPGVIAWNRESIELDTGTKALSAATSASSIRGKTINCLTGDMKSTFRDKETGEIIEMSMNELKERLI